MMLARVADALYWMGRYLERAENTARVLAVQHNALIDNPVEDANTGWRRVLQGLAIPHPVQDEIDSRAAFASVLLDRAEPASFVAALSNARENARQLREQVSSEMWECLNKQYLAARQASFDENWEDRLQDFCQQAIDGLHHFAGVTTATMSRGEGWRFIRIGYTLERAQFLSRLLEAYFAPAAETGAPGRGGLVTLLKMCSAFEAFCKAKGANISAGDVAAFLVFDRDFPRSLSFAVHRLRNELTQLAPESRSPSAGQAQRLVGRAAAALEYGSPEDLGPGRFREFLRTANANCEAIHRAINETYITYPVTARIAS